MSIITHVVTAVTAWWMQARFSVKDRTEFYETLTLLLDNGVLLNDAFVEMFNIYSDDGKKPKRIRAMVAQECLLGIGEGKALSAVLASWVSYDEFSLIEAGEQAGDLQSAFRKSIRVVEAKAQIGQAVATATIYPGILGAQGAYLLQKVSTDLVPKLGRSTNPETWNPPAQLLKVIADFVTSYGGPALAAVLIALATAFASLPYLRGNIRYYLDKIPPWSIYRMMLGSPFMLNVGVLLGSGVKLNEALERMGRRANPWLKQRIDATLYGVNIGANLGQALYKAGYDFPDKRAVQYLRVISGRDGSEENIERFGDRWMDESVKRLKSLAGVLLGSAILLNGVLMLLVITGANGISDAMLSGMDR